MPARTDIHSVCICLLVDRHYAVFVHSIVHLQYVLFAPVLEPVVNVCVPKQLREICVQKTSDDDVVRRVAFSSARVGRRGFDLNFKFRI